LEDLFQAVFDLLLRWLKRKRYVFLFLAVVLAVLTAAIYLLATG
jgi:hypothetical protein